jgi:hypothetical protein
MKIDPEAAVKFEDRKRPIAEVALRLARRPNWGEQRECQQKERESGWSFVRHL